LTRHILDARGVTADNGTAKARIERAALILFVEKSIEGVSTKSIATRAGVSEGLLYRHFKSKDDLTQLQRMKIGRFLPIISLICTASQAYQRTAPCARRQI